MKGGSSQQSPAFDAPPQLLIFLATFHGEKYLSRQLDSYLTQSWPHWAVWASDDGSRDGTLDILHAYQHAMRGRLWVQQGPGQGFVRNFLGMACHAPPRARHYAFSDQDDIWLPHKLARAVQWLDALDADTPALYCASAALVDAHGRVTGHCWQAGGQKRPPGFANALVQNIAGGNTMVFNHAARELLRRAGCAVAVPFHDWWLYLLVSGCGGRVLHDAGAPVIHYRQHGGNVVGMRHGWLLERLRGLHQMGGNHFRTRLRQNLLALEGRRADLTQESRQVLDAFTRACQAPQPWQRVRLLRQSGVYRQSLHGNLGLALAAMTGKL